MLNQSFSATIVSINAEVKEKSNGKQYLNARVKFTEGALKEKTYFAQRTLGENKASIAVGQEVRCILNLVTNEDGTQLPFFEISTSIVSNQNEILAALGL
jgi:hypothetical protein